MDDSNLKNIVVLGGGTAGWMTASLLQKQWQRLGIKITVVESPDIGIIGVGEGSTPLLKVFFDSLEISESEWMPECNATYKNGISFNNWSTVSGYESYFHPFPCSLDFATFGFNNPTIARNPNFALLVQKCSGIIIPENKKPDKSHWDVIKDDYKKENPDIKLMGDKFIGPNE